MTDAIAPEQLAGPHEVIEILGLANRSHLKYYRDTDHTFPKPIVRLKIGELWDRREVVAWWDRRKRP